MCQEKSKKEEIKIPVLNFKRAGIDFIIVFE